MEPIRSQSLYAFVEPNGSLDTIDNCLTIASSVGHEVKSYIELLEKFATLKYHNKSLALLFRGQPEDYLTRPVGNYYSSLYPSIYRLPLTLDTQLARRDELRNRFERLHKLDTALVEAFKKRRFANDRIARWSIIQHYELCETPLLDVTNSLQVALSFALRESRKEAYLFVVGVPQLNGSYSVSLDSGTQTISLSQICPPDALRPHFQEAHLLANYPLPDIDGVLSPTRTFQRTLQQNFCCRIVAKFHLQQCDTSEWYDFTPTADKILFPNERDTFYRQIKNVVGSSVL